MDYRSDLFYLCKDGTFLSRSKVEQSFTICTGLEYSPDTRVEFMKFLERVWGKHILMACHPDEYALLLVGDLVSAVSLIRRRDGLTVLDAHKKVKKIREAIDSNDEYRDIDIPDIIA